MIAFLLLVIILILLMFFRPIRVITGSLLLAALFGAAAALLIPSLHEHESRRVAVYVITAVGALIPWWISARAARRRS